MSAFLLLPKYEKAMDRIAALEADLITARTEVECLSDSCKAALKNYDEARAEATALREELSRVTEGMYARAWQRELGPWMRRKNHHIDACVLSTRDLRAAAEDHTKPHCCGQPEYCTDHGCAKLLRHRMGLDAAIDQAHKESGNG
jgi:hypothetical protein